MAGNERHIVHSKRAILAASVIATVVVYLPGSFAKPSWPIDWLLAQAFVTCGLLTLVPFALARMVPQSGFNTQWFPQRIWHWGVFFILLVAVLGISRGVPWLRAFLGFPRDPSFLLCGAVTPMKITCLGILFAVLYPIAEEVFWRGYLLEQLRKLTSWPIALLSQSALFSAVHLLRVGPVASVAAFGFGFLLGLWRIRFRSLLPMILAHIFVNCLAEISQMAPLYRLMPLLEKPQVQEINRLTFETPSKAIPSLLEFLADPDQEVRDYALYTLESRYRADAEPYVRQALVTKDPRALEALLSLVGICRYSGLKHEVRDVVWSVADRGLEISAITTLSSLQDIEGLQMIASTHSNETVRRAAARTITYMNSANSERNPGPKRSY